MLCSHYINKGTRIIYDAREFYTKDVNLMWVDTYFMWVDVNFIMVDAIYIIMDKYNIRDNEKIKTPNHARLKH